MVGQVHGVKQQPLFFVHGAEPWMGAQISLKLLEIVQGFAQLFQCRFFITLNSFNRRSLHGRTDAGGNYPVHRRFIHADRTDDMFFPPGHFPLKSFHRTFHSFPAVFQNLKIRPIAGGDDRALFQIRQFPADIVDFFKSEFSAQGGVLSIV